MDREGELKTLFGRIDALVEKDESLSMDELKAVFGEHADEFIKYCDGQAGGEEDKKLTFDEFKSGILADTKDMTDDEFKANWVDRMTQCVVDAEAAKPAAEEEAAPAAEEEAAPAAEEEAAPAAGEEAGPAAEEEAAPAADEEAAPAAAEEAAPA